MAEPDTGEVIQRGSWVCFYLSILLLQLFTFEKGVTPELCVLLIIAISHAYFPGCDFFFFTVYLHNDWQEVAHAFSYSTQFFLCG